MIYFDVDGVIADFVECIIKKYPSIVNDWSQIYKVVVENYNRCYLDSRVINQCYIDYIKNNNCSILTSLPKKEKILPYIKNTNEFNLIYNTLHDNKIEWLNSIGIYNNIYIVDCPNDKIKYCKDLNDCLYDDNIDTIIKWNKVGTNGILVYNKFRNI